MKKVLFALTLCLVLCVSLLSCGKTMTGADYLFDSLDNLAGTMQNKKVNKLTENLGSGMEMTLGVSDVNALLGTAGASLPTLTNASLSYAVKEQKQALGLGVTMNDKPYALSLASNGKDIALVTDMLSKNYGITVEELQGLLGDQLPKNAIDALEAAGSVMDVKAVQKFFDLLEKAMREKVEFTTVEDGDQVKVSFTLTPDTISDVFEMMLPEIKDSGVAKYLLFTLDPNGDMNTAFDASADDAQGQIVDLLTDAGFAADFTAVVAKKGTAFVALSGNIAMDDETTRFDIAAADNGFRYSIDQPDVSMNMTVAAADGMYQATVVAETNGTTATVEMNFENGTGTFKVSADDAVLYTMNLTYTLTDKALDMKLVGLEAGGSTVDLGDAGVTLHFGGEFVMPEVPAEYTSVADFTQTDWQTILFDLIGKNPELGSLLMGSMQ